jgi:hypothetical protein
MERLVIGFEIHCFGVNLLSDSHGFGWSADMIWSLGFGDLGADFPPLCLGRFTIARDG